MGLAAGQVAWLFEVSKILVIHDDGRWMSHPSEVMFPFFQGMKDHKEFLIVDVVILLCWREGLGVVCTGV